MLVSFASDLHDLVTILKWSKYICVFRPAEITENTIVSFEKAIKQVSVCGVCIRCVHYECCWTVIKSPLTKWPLPSLKLSTLVYVQVSLITLNFCSVVYQSFCDGNKSMPSSVNIPLIVCFIVAMCAPPHNPKCTTFWNYSCGFWFMLFI